MTRSLLKHMLLLKLLMGLLKFVRINCSQDMHLCKQTHNTRIRLHKIEIQSICREQDMKSAFRWKVLREVWVICIWQKQIMQIRRDQQSMLTKSRMGNKHYLARKIKNATVAGETTSLLLANLRMRNVIAAKRKATRRRNVEIARKDQEKKPFRKDERREQKSANYFVKEEEGAYTMYHVTGDKNKAITIDIDLCGYNTNNGT
ncbi:Hypothetical predicted protein [Paramuricea clavata]|uniref:Uncharacterized protein n=1 Tax=Paramuricea clavata TaxID=317549 RepID=A0A7D9LI27_PARCT|nr:Hypothetical predicted protein [Paramuricea clavata]